VEGNSGRIRGNPPVELLSFDERLGVNHSEEQVSPTPAGALPCGGHILALMLDGLGFQSGGSLEQVIALHPHHDRARYRRDHCCWMRNGQQHHIQPRRAASSDGLRHLERRNHDRPVHRAVRLAQNRGSARGGAGRSPAGSARNGVRDYPAGSTRNGTCDLTPGPARDCGYSDPPGSTSTGRHRSRATAGNAASPARA